MKSVAMLLLVFAGISLLVAVKNIIIRIGAEGASEASSAVASAGLAGYVVGSMLLPAIFLFAGLVLLGKSK
jgi:hypothetical protein